MTTKTQDLIESEHNTNIQEIRVSHHDRHEISHEEYHGQLNAENERYEAELIAEGYSLNAAPPEWQEEWAKADTADKKMAVLARMQGLKG